MITRLEIDNYKCIQHEELDIKPLTIITGLNSTGKSTLIQSVLLPEQMISNTNLGLSVNFDMIKCRYSNQDTINIRVFWDGDEFKTYKATKESSEVTTYDSFSNVGIEDGVYYLSANRIGAEDVVRLANTHSVGPRGENIFGLFELEKSNPVDEPLRRYKESYTLQYQLDNWLTYILGINLRLSTEKINEETLTVKYESDRLQNITPRNLGAGVSYLVKVLILCLRAKRGNVLLIENPEIHLHPSAQAKLGEFLAFMANAGIQLIIETHCEHLINRIQYAIYKKAIGHDKVLLLYKAGITDKFQQIPFNADGKFAIMFPDGFFDATLDELIEME